MIVPLRDATFLQITRLLQVTSTDFDVPFLFLAYSIKATTHIALLVLLLPFQSDIEEGDEEGQVTDLDLLKLLKHVTGILWAVKGPTFDQKGPTFRLCHGTQRQTWKVQRRQKRCGARSAPRLF